MIPNPWCCITCILPYHPESGESWLIEVWTRKEHFPSEQDDQGGVNGVANKLNGGGEHLCPIENHEYTGVSCTLCRTVEQTQDLTFVQAGIPLLCTTGSPGYPLLWASTFHVIYKEWLSLQ